MYEGIYTTAEAVYSLPSGVIAAVVGQESNGYPWSGRYEPGFFAHSIAGKTRSDLGGLWPVDINETTERQWRATSWGLMQIMGQVARELGFPFQALSQLCDPVLGVHYGAAHLAHQYRRYGGDLKKALSAYNAGTATTANYDGYVLPVIQRMER